MLLILTVRVRMRSAVNRPTTAAVMAAIAVLAARAGLAGFARDIASRVCFLADGQIAEQAPPAQLFTQPADERTRRFLRRIIDAGRL